MSYRNLEIVPKLKPLNIHLRLSTMESETNECWTFIGPFDFLKRNQISKHQNLFGNYYMVDLRIQSISTKTGINKSVLRILHAFILGFIYLSYQFQIQGSQRKQEGGHQSMVLIEGKRKRSLVCGSHKEKEKAAISPWCSQRERECGHLSLMFLYRMLSQPLVLGSYRG